MNMKPKRTIAGLALALSASIASSAVLYGVTGAGNAPSSLYTVNPVSGATTLIGATGFSHVTGIDFDPTSGILYGVVSDIANTGAELLITINPANGLGTLIGSTGHQIPDITIGPDGILRGWSECMGAGCVTTDDPITIDKATGMVTDTPSGLNTASTGVAWRSPTSIYVKAPNGLFSVDVNTGVAAGLFDPAIPLSNILENDPGGADWLIAGHRDNGGTQFYHLVVGTGTTTPLGHANVQFSAVAFKNEPAGVPEPGTLLLMALGLGSLAAMRRRIPKRA